ncbi:hypothetical protein DXU04_12865 [Bradyrhizobium diazoefficiens]|nr:hypothetical protein AF336_25580 [Bradyrhizobium diazoefficiens]
MHEVLRFSGTLILGPILLARFLPLVSDGPRQICDVRKRIAVIAVLNDRVQQSRFRIEVLVIVWVRSTETGLEGPFSKALLPPILYQRVDPVQVDGRRATFASLVGARFSASFSVKEIVVSLPLRLGWHTIISKIAVVVFGAEVFGLVGYVVFQLSFVSRQSRLQLVFGEPEGPLRFANKSPQAFFMRRKIDAGLFYRCVIAARPNRPSNLCNDIGRWVIIVFVNIRLSHLTTSAMCLA